MAGEFARMLKQKQPDLHIEKEEILTVEVAGLCHDLGEFTLIEYSGPSLIRTPILITLLACIKGAHAWLL